MLVPSEVQHALTQINAYTERRSEARELIAIGTADIENSLSGRHNELQQSLQRCVIVAAAGDPLLAVCPKLIIKSLYPALLTAHQVPMRRHISGSRIRNMLRIRNRNRAHGILPSQAESNFDRIVAELVWSQVGAL